MRNGIIFLAGFFLIFTSGLRPQKDIREDMVVINVEIPVRVQFNGKPVDNLRKSDFRLFEDGKEIPINGFHIVRKKISEQKIGFDTTRTEYYEPRLFSLVFSLVQYNRDLEKGLKHIFDRVLRKEDKLLVLINNKLLSYNDLRDMDAVYTKVKHHLKNEGHNARARLDRTLRKVQRDLSVALSSRRQNVHYALHDFLEHYIRTFEEYKRDYLTADINKYYNFSRFLERIKMKKWVISFFQVELFPRLKKMDSILGMIRGYIERFRMSNNAEEVYFGRQLERLITKIYSTQDADTSFDTEEISKLFYRVNTTFHSVLIPSRIQLEDRNYEYKRISSALENNLREITDKTGGELLATTDLGDALETIKESQDVVYMLTYAPETESRRGKLKVMVNNREYKVVFDDNTRAGYLTRYLNKKSRKKKIIRMEKIAFENKRLQLKLKNYRIGKQGEKISKCSLGIRIEVKEGDQSIFNEGKVLKSHNSEMDLSINMNWLKPGKYDLLVDVLLRDGFGLLEFFTEEVAKVDDVQDFETFVVYKSFGHRVPYVL